MYNFGNSVTDMDFDPELAILRQRRAMELMKMQATQQMDVSMAPDSPLNVTDANFQQTLGQHELVLVDFWAPWCGPCRMVAPMLEELALEQSGKLVVAKLNTDENQQTAQQFGIMSIPTMILFKNGQVVDQMVGALPKQMLMSKLAQHLN